MAGCGSCLSLCLVRAQRPVSLRIDSHTGVTNVHRWNWTNVGSPTLSVLVLKYGEGTLKNCLRAPRGVALRSVGTESWREAENETCPHVLPRAVVLFFVRIRILARLFSRTFEHLVVPRTVLLYVNFAGIASLLE